MRRTPRLLALLLLPLAPLAAAAGCGDDQGGTSAPDLSVDAARPPDLAPARPVAGAQIDRVGRPLIQTLLVNPLDGDGKQAAQLADWNANGDAATWVGGFSAPLSASLGLYDVMDGRCGNQVRYDAAAGGADFTPAGYVTLASALADDRLFLDTTRTTCRQFFAVELTALQMMSVADCGGRAPGYDVADFLFGLLAGSNLPVSDNVPADSGRAASPDTFPFLADPE